MQQGKYRQDGSQEQGDGNLFLNLGKIVLLVAVLAAAWFVLEWLMNSN